MINDCKRKRLLKYLAETEDQTGDLARWLPDGNIEFVGRTDNQVKIRGVRIKQQEIENRLFTHKRIKQAVVMDRAAENGIEIKVNYHNELFKITTIEGIIKLYVKILENICRNPDKKVEEHFITNKRQRILNKKIKLLYY